MYELKVEQMCKKKAEGTCKDDKNRQSAVRFNARASARNRCTPRGICFVKKTSLGLMYELEVEQMCKKQAEGTCKDDKHRQSAVRFNARASGEESVHTQLKKMWGKTSQNLMYELQVDQRCKKQAEGTCKDDKPRQSAVRFNARASARTR